MKNKRPHIIYDGPREFVATRREAQTVTLTLECGCALQAGSELLVFVSPFRNFAESDLSGRAVELQWTLRGVETTNGALEIAARSLSKLDDLLNGGQRFFPIIAAWSLPPL